MSNKYIIENIKIQNFKCIENFELGNQELNKLVVFDGPNGYGKTTVFEAIEIILTERPRKHRQTNLDARYKFNDSPIHKIGDKEISLELILNDGVKSISIKRIFPPNKGKSKINNIYNIFNDSTLLINNENASFQNLEEALGFNNLYNLFSILNYVEQDENTFFLKKDPKERYSSFLESLLGVDKEKQELQKIEALESKISKEQGKIKDRTDEISKHSDDSYSLKNNISYKRIIEKKDFDWDRENLELLDIGTKNSYLLEIKKISNLIANKHNLKNIDLRLQLNRFSNSTFYTELIDYYWSVTNFELLKKEFDTKQSNLSQISKNQLFIKNIIDKDYSFFNQEEIKTQLNEKFVLQLDLSILFQFLNNIKILQEGQDLQDKVLSSFSDRRKDLLNLRDQHIKDINLKEGECPTCGFDWKTNDELVKQIESTETKIFEEYIKTNKSIEEFKEKINKEYFIPIQTSLLKENELLEEENKTLVEKDTFNLLTEKIDVLKNKFEHFFKLIEKKDSLIDIISKRVIEDKEAEVLKIEEIVNSLKPSFSEDLDIETTQSDFEIYFEKSLENLELLNEDDLNNKIDYIKLQFSISINSEIQKLKEKADNYKKSLEEIGKIITIYKTKLKEYTNEIVNKISIPFHIYTGKILQNHSLGSGLSIHFETEKNSQIYIRPSSKDQEVAYLLSSGQLSATVISLMLVLNKVFNKSKLGVVFIDDPLQTLDEINSHSLVELLKYNFRDQQLILSTHEDRYSKFIRYKYEKFGIESISVNMKNNI